MLQMDLSKEQEEWLLIRKDGDACPLPRSMIFVGREECDVILLTPSVDKRHAVIFFDSNSKQFHVKDLNSTCGTYLNGVRIPEQSYVKLNHMDNIRFGFGPEMFLVCRSSSSDSKEPLSPEAQAQKSKSSQNTESVNLPERKVADGSPSSDSKQDSAAEKSESLIAVDSLEDVRSASDELTTPVAAPATLKESPASGSGNTGCINAASTSSPKKNSPPDWKTENLEVLYISEEKDDGLKSSPVTDETSKSPIVTSDVAMNSSSSTEKSNIPSPSTPASMAFTIAFDNNPVVPRKKLGIRDSLSRFAPTKSDTDRSLQRTRSAKDAPEKKPNLSDKSPGLSRKTYSARDTKGQQGKHDTKEVSVSKEKSAPSSVNGQLSDSANYLIRRMLYNDRGCPDGGIGPEKHQESAKMTSVPPSLVTVGKTYKSSPPDKTPKSNNKQESQKVVLSPGDKDTTGDDKSETGTYTVDIDQLDPAVEEARKKIDEVFGVLEKVNNGPLQMRCQKESERLSSSSTSRISSHHEAFWLQNDHDSNTADRKDVRHLPPQGLRVQGPFMLHETQSDGSIMKNDRGLPGSATFTRPKRRLPTPPGEKAPTELSLYNPAASDKPETHQLNTFSVAKPKRSVQNITHDCGNESPQPFYLGPCPGSPSMDKSATATSKARKGDQSASNKMIAGPPRGLPLFHHRQSEVVTNHSVNHISDKMASEGTPPTPGSAESNLNLPFKSSSTGNTPWRKNTWNLSTSDLELNKCETSSVKSENSTSTEPSSQSSHSGKSKGETQPQMRLNRAFALRRARLGIDTPAGSAGKNGATGKEGRQTSSGNTSPYSSNSSLTKTPTSNSPVLTSGSLVRQDGGRFSLRLPRNVRAPLVKSESAKNSSSKEDLSKLRHKRNDSDPGRPVTKIMSFRSTNHSDSEPAANLMTTSMICTTTSSSEPASIQRSASFSSTDGLGLQEEKKTNNNNNPFKVPRHMLSLRTHGLPKSDQKTNAAKDRQSHKPAETSRSRPVTPSEKSVSLSHTDMRNASKSQSQLQASKKEITALDSLVVSAIYQLSQKLRGSARAVLEKERLKYAQGSEIRLMIDEVLPQMADKRPSSETASEGNLSRDLSNILKNLKKVEQSLEVVFLLMDPENRPTPSADASKDGPPRSNFFIVDV